MNQRERVHEGGLFECISHVVGFLQAVQHRQPTRSPLGPLAGVREQLVGLALPVLGAQHLGLGLGGVAGVLQGIAQSLGQRVREGGVLGQQVELKGALAQHACQQQARFIGHQRHGLLLTQQHAGQAQQLQQISAGSGPAQHIVEPVTDMEGLAVHGLHGVVDQALGSRQQPGHVPPVVARCLCEQLDGLGFAHKMLQALAGPVPVDHEDDARGDVFQAGLQLGLAVRLQTCLPHQIGLASIEPFRHPGVEDLPGKPHVFEHLPKKTKAPRMQVGIGQRDGAALHLDDQHMDVVGADIVLDQQALAVARDGGVQTGVRELQGGRAVQAAHEGLNQRAVVVVHLPDMSAIDVVGGQFARKGVDLLVQVHYQQVQAVARLVVAVGQLVQVCAVQTFIVGQAAQFLQPVVAPPGQRRSASLPGVAHRACHGGQIVAQRLHQAVQAGQDKQVVIAIGTTHQLRGPGGIRQPRLRNILFPAPHRPIGR